ncbi:hypothetical protein HanRHA438_Chr17g0806861 [Helianthus annuus]|nr:hypothetical protein HanRHA438_Chr17g0806861 [Helianthus annuus]
MARRDSDYSRVRRIADRGNGRDGLDSRSRDEGQRCVRRTADRGNDRVDSEARDLKIMRLQRRVQDPELQNEIVRLKKRIQDLEAVPVWEEREPEEPVRDEEHPTHSGSIYDSPPVYDEYGDEDWYSWVIGGDLPGDESCSKSRNVEGVTSVKSSGVAVAPAGEAMANGGHTMDEVGSEKNIPYWGTLRMTVENAYLKHNEKEQGNVFCNITAYPSFDKSRLLSCMLETQRASQYVLIKEAFLSASTVCTMSTSMASPFQSVHLVSGKDWAATGGEESVLGGTITWLADKNGRIDYLLAKRGIYLEFEF